MPLLAFISTSLSMPLSSSRTLGIRIPFEFPIGTSEAFIVITLYIQLMITVKMLIVLLGYKISSVSVIALSIVIELVTRAIYFEIIGGNNNVTAARPKSTNVP